MLLEKELPITILSGAARAIQRLFGPGVEKAALASGVIRRQRVLTAGSLARIFVMGFLSKPRASDEDLAHVAAVCGTPVSPQAIDQRHSPRLVAFLKALLGHAVEEVVGSDKALAGVLERFSSVAVLDSSTIALPDSQAKEYPGCGGGHGEDGKGTSAALKLQTEIDLRTGALTCLQVEAGRASDNVSARQYVRRGPGSLRIADLGYFCLSVLASIVAAGEHYLSRLHYGTQVFPENGEAVKLLRWLAKRSGSFIDEPVWLGKEERLPCRLIAWRLPADQANERRRKLRATLLRKKGRVPSAERLAWCDWTILVTSVPRELLNPQEATVLYRARWQIELLFKRWKSDGLIAELTGSTELRKMVRLWARLLAVLVQHWLVAPIAGGNPLTSWSKAYKAVRPFAGRLLASLGYPLEFERVLDDLARVIEKTCLLNKRTQTGTNELLIDFNKLNYD